MGRLKELINKFIQPNEKDKTFDELALASGIDANSLNQLKSSMEGISWTKFAREEEDTKKKTKSSILKTDNNDIIPQQQEKTTVKKAKSQEDMDREQ